jgi:Flp pilus assembly protein TadD
MGTRSRPLEAQAAPRPAPRRPSSGLDELLPVLKALVIVLLGVFIYAPALHGDWLWDDQDLLPHNELMQDPDGWWRIWLQPWVMFDFMPVKISVEWAEWHLFGDDTFGYHVVSLVLHLLSALLLWRFFTRLGLRYAWLGAVLFTVHPVHVESVAWISELKNTLSLPFFLLAMTAWVDYETRRKSGLYVAALLLFLVAMLAKPTMAMFPVVILLYAWWKRGRIGRGDIVAASPFFIISLAVGATAAYFLHRSTGEQHVLLGGPLSRMACAGLCLAFYFSKCVLPLCLLSTYPQWPVNPPSPLQFLPWPVLLGVLAFLWTKRTTWGRHALLGLGFFLLNLAPFLGLSAASYMNFTWVMDHLLYIPSLGLIGLAVAAAAHIASLLPAPGRTLGAGLVVVLIGWMTWTSHEYAFLYQNLRTLWTYNVAQNPGSALSHNDLGTTYASEGDNVRAMEEFRIAEQLDPRYADAHHNIAIILMNTGHLEEATAELQLAIAQMPQVGELHYSLGNALALSHQRDAAIAQYAEAINLQPDLKVGYHNLKVLLSSEGRKQEAFSVVQLGLSHFPNDQQLQADLLDLEGKLPPQQRP